MSASSLPFRLASELNDGSSASNPAADKMLITVNHIEELEDFVELELEGELTEETEQTFESLIDQFNLDDCIRMGRDAVSEA